MQSVLIHMHDDSGQRARAVAAIAVARALPAHLLCVQTVDFPFAVEPVRMPPSIAQASVGATLAARHGVADRDRAALEADLAAAGVSVEWHQRDGDPRDALDRYATLADLAILSLPGHAVPGPPPAALAEAVVLQLDIPVLAVPPGLASFDLTAPALVAWDGSPACGAAVRAAAPLLRHARQVTVLTVNGADQWAASAEDAAAYLERAGAKAAVRRLDNIASTSSALLGESESGGVSFLVMGLYGHGRIAERVLGGVTTRLLREAVTPLLLAR